MTTFPATLVTPPDIVPYYFAVEPSPTDPATAFAMARPAAGGTDGGISVVLEHRDRCTEIFRFSQLGFVNIAWSTGGRLAFAQASTLMVRERDGTLRLGELPGHVEWLGFDRDQRLWCHAGGRLEHRRGSHVTAIADQVERAAVSGFAAYCRRDQAGIGVFLHDGDSGRQLAHLSESVEGATVELSLRGNYLLVVLASRSVRNRARVRLVRFDMATNEIAALMDECIAFGFNGGPAIRATVLSSGEVLAAYESGETCQVWSLSPGTRPRPLSPPEFEVFDFVADAAGTHLAIIASDTRNVCGASERQLLIAERNGAAWWFLAPVAGVFQMPRWRHDGGLEVLCSEGGRWTRQSGNPAKIGPHPAACCCRGDRVRTETIEYDWLTLAGPRDRRAGVVLLPRLHQQFAAGAQSFFFHHLIFCIARSLAMRGYHVAVLHGPGSIGAGRSRREPAGSYFLALRAAINDLTRVLASQGCTSIGILAGSLAAVPALRFLGPGSRFSACALIAPLFESSIPVTKPVEDCLLHDPAIEPLKQAAANAAAPMLIVHGARDEVVPLSQITELRNGVRNPGMVELCVFEEEGHIFKRAQSWMQADSKILDFFSSHLQ